jgi:nucleoside-diphosphate-sugar epimerase
MPGVPKIGFSVVDVRDLAAAQALAMTNPQAAGQRFIACGEFMWMADIAKALRAALPPAQAEKIPKRVLPNFLVRLAARRDRGLRGITPTLGRRHAFNSAKAQRVLGWTPRPGRETVVDCAVSLIRVGVD